MKSLRSVFRLILLLNKVRYGRYDLRVIFSSLVDELDCVALVLGCILRYLFHQTREHAPDLCKEWESTKAIRTHAL